MLFIFLILFSHPILALIYNDTCIENCDFPGMICVNNRCVCDSKNHLFWTNTRCLSCPNDWVMTETGCVIYYEKKMSWERAALTCRNLQAELISFRNRDIISVLTKGNISGSPKQLSAWTSARRSNLSDSASVYQWLDTSIPPFTDESDWWCKNTTQHLGYVYRYNEPTKYTFSNNEKETCVVYWRGITNTQVVCLDDQLCSQEFPFVCEKSESTANQYLGPPPSKTADAVRANIIHTVPGNVGTIVVQLGPGNSKLAKKSSSFTVIVLLIVIGIVLLLVFIGGFYYLRKRPNILKKQINTFLHPQISTSVSIKSDPSEHEEAIDLNTVTEKDQQPRRGGFTKQQFDELE